ncbi:MAG TPA: transglycosylase domain-containing protein [Longimicrobiales bacterium]|nr:transglycosylase domain-containing protein [Longimicrobiales bacterium]
MSRKKILLIALAVAGALALTVPVFAVLTIAGVNGGCPSVDALRNYRPPEASKVYAADGSLVADLSPQRRTLVTLDQVPLLVRQGVVAVEDRRFRQHGAVDYRGLARAIWRDATSLSFRQGFSTITMQLVRSVFPEQLPMSKRFSRKVCEVYLSGRLEHVFTKDQILGLYMNQVYFGEGLYGIQAASEGYFGVPVQDLGPAQAALLIGLIRSPEGYNPRRHPMAAIRRRNVVLGVMAREGVITRSQAQRASAAPVFLTAPEEAHGRAPYYVAEVRRALNARLGPDADLKGLRVYTGLDLTIQQAAQQALSDQIRRIESGAYGRYTHPTTPAADTLDGASALLQGMVVVMDPATGEIRGLVGGRDYGETQFDRAFQARRQPGAAFKPFIYAAALERGLTVTARVGTAPVLVNDPGAAPWSPSDHVPDSVQTLSVRDALSESSNHAAVRVGQWVGVSQVVSLARTLGITTPIPPYPSILLGSADVVPAEMVAAYAAFGNGGYRVPPTLITRVEDRAGNVLWQAPMHAAYVLNSGVAFLTLTLLEDVVNEGTGTAVRRDGFSLPAAGKTGTTNDGKDAWFIGLTPDLVAGVWLGFDRPQNILRGASGGRLAAPVWAALMKRIYEGRPEPAPWAPPYNVTSAAVDLTSGLLATDACPRDDVRVEYFLRGTEPVEYCPLHPDDNPLHRLWRRLRGIF